MADGNSFVAVVNDTTTKLTRTTKNGKEKTYSPSYKTVISGNNHAQLLGKKIGDVIDGIFVGEGRGRTTHISMPHALPMDVASRIEGRVARKLKR